MLSKQKTFLLAILLSVSFAAHGQLLEMQSNSLVPVEWQAIRLQENIEAKINRSLKPIIKDSDYVIEVKIDVDTESQEDPSSKKITKTQQRKKIKFSTLEAPEDGDDYVVFNKIGLEAPIIGEDEVETETSEVELAQKAIIEMNDRFNLFKFLRGIQINLTFDKEISEKSRLNIKKVIEGLSFNTKDIIPQINIQYLELKASQIKDEPTALAKSEALAEAKKKEEKEKTSLSDRFKNLDIMIAIILAAMILGSVALLIARLGAKTFVDFKEEKPEEPLAEEEAEDEAEKIEENPEDALAEEMIEEEDDMSIDLTKTDPLTNKINAGLEKFRKMQETHFNEMTLMLKGWIKASRLSSDDALGLRALVQILSDNELAEIFKSLSIDERNSWKNCLDTELTKEDLGKAFTFISNKVLEAMLVPSMIDDYEICDLLLAIKAEDASGFCIKHPELGPVFANVLSAKTISEMFESMPVEVTADIIERSSNITKEEIISKMPLLKEKLLEVKFRRERPPFLARIFDILPNAKIEIEKKLYSTLIKHCSLDEVRETALNLLPQNLITNLPDAIFRGVIDKMPLEEQVDYFCMFDSEERKEQLNRFASKGAKNREMLEIEISAIAKNELLLRKIQNDKRDFIEEKYLIAAREYISSNVEAKNEMRLNIEIWLKEIKSEDVTEIRPRRVEAV